MNKQEVLYLIIFASVMYAGRVFSHMQGNHYRSLDPTVDFRAPQSLTERMHEGLITVEAILQGASGTNEGLGAILSDLSSELVRLSDAYDSMIGKSNRDRVYGGDREYLQKMIDRIDMMIHELERSVNLSDEDESVLRENIELVGQLRSKMVE
ncbi:MAG: hypothetical protein NTZ68_00515 [Candidatus Dependentiae bacterium]|nr:hypothetical protein [Candidatus Dependentiae bacterium]